MSNRDSLLKRYWIYACVTLICVVLLFVNIFVTNSWTGEKTFSEFVQRDWVLYAVFLIEEVIIVFLMFLFGMLAGKNLKKYNLEIETIAASSMPSWDDIVEIMYDKQLDSFCDEIINVFYSKDKSMRYVILKDEKGIFKYHLEVIYQFDAHEWQYICSDDDVLPATWGPCLEKSSSSLFASEEDLMRELEFEPEYRQYFV